MTQCETQITPGSTSGCLSGGRDWSSKGVGAGELDTVSLGGSQEQPLGALPGAWFSFSTGGALRHTGVAWHRMSGGGPEGSAVPTCILITNIWS